MSDPQAPRPHNMDLRARYLIAIVAFVATAFGATTGGLATIYAAHKNAQTQESVAKENFDKSQRIEAYRTCLIDALQLSQAAVAFLQDPNYGESETDPDGQLERAFQSSRDRFEASVVPVRLLGSSQIAADAEHAIRIESAFAKNTQFLAQSLAKGNGFSVKLIKQSEDQARQFSLYTENKMSKDVRKELF